MIYNFVLGDVLFVVKTCCRSLDAFSIYSLAIQHLYCVFSKKSFTARVEFLFLAVSEFLFLAGNGGLGDIADLLFPDLKESPGLFNSRLFTCQCLPGLCTLQPSWLIPY
ncbi:hypothetical protein XELAEV_18046401mg [Xenopus laevis]|uniref:Uncharacterized protein n=1 Tax=Xenopus laevis TaxID=8355 RepID=A0A974BTA0_XENLA|nr:hypothetical protein XELAEV_18046401mg [Xenopus laevis]